MAFSVTPPPGFRWTIFSPWASPNGLGGCFYLWAACRFLVAVVPRQANLALGLFLLGGSPSGVLYLATGLLGLHASPDFDANFYRYAVYDLMEGQHIWPITLLPRLYYTLPLAAAFAAFTCLVRSFSPTPRPGRPVMAISLTQSGTVFGGQAKRH